MQKEPLQSIDKPKAPKNYTYILKSSQLNELLLQNEFYIHTHLVYWIPQETGSIFEVHYWLPNANVPYPRLYIRAGALSRNDAPVAKELMEYKVFPEFVGWLSHILKQPNHSTVFNKPPYFNAVFKDNELVFYKA